MNATATTLAGVDVSRTGEIPPADVVVGERARRDYGDLEPLIQSMSELGQLQPIGLAPNNELLFGGRRLEVAKRLGWRTISYVRPLDREDARSLLLAERDENTCRKDMTASEMVELGQRIEALEAPKAKERLREGQDSGRDARYGRDSGRSSIGDRPAPDRKVRKTNAIVAEALGVSEGTYYRAKSVVKAAEDESLPAGVREVAAKARDEMDCKVISITAAADKVREAKTPAAIVVDPRIAPDVKPKVHGPRPNHLKILTNLTTGLGGYAIAADDITELNDTVNKEEAAQLLSELSRSIQSLNRIKSLLKERSK